MTSSASQGLFLVQPRLRCFQSKEQNLKVQQFSVSGTGEESVVIPEPIQTATIETVAAAGRNQLEALSVSTLRSSVLLMQRAHWKRR